MGAGAHVSTGIGHSGLWACRPNRLAARLFFGLGNPAKPTIDAAMFFWRSKDKDPKAPVLEDVRNFWNDEQPHRWKFILASLVLTLGMVFMMLHDFKFWGAYKEPEIEWVTSYDKNRTTADVIADQARFAEEARIEAETDAREREERKAAYRRLGKRFGIDAPKQ